MKRSSLRTNAAILLLFFGAATSTAQTSQGRQPYSAKMRATMPPTASTVTDWNAIALQFLAPATFSSTRILAMTHLAIYDSVMAITHDHEPYAVSVRAPRWTSAEAAVAAAAHKVLVNQLPAQAAGLDGAYDAALAAIPDGIQKANGIALGEFVANRILELRAADVLGPATYSQPMAPGVWQPSGDGYNTGVVATTWPSLTPFALRSTRQFRAPRPPALTSREYAINVNLTKSLGAKFSTTRTPDQTAAAFFWSKMARSIFQRARARTGHVTRVRPVANRTAVRTPERRDGRWVDDRLRHEVRLQLLATDRRDPGRGR